MKVKSARDDAMVRLVVGGNPVFVTNVPMEIDESDEDAMNQVNSMISLGWLVRVQEEVKEDVQEEKVQEEVKEEVREEKVEEKQTVRRRRSK
jgi:urease accessory protein UreH